MHNLISVVIVTFNPNIDELIGTVRSAQDAKVLIVIVDNHSDNIFEIKTTLEQVPNCILVTNKENLGIAKALNQGFCVSESRHAKWVLTLDQDSKVDVDKILEQFSKILSLHIPDVAIIAPRVKDINTGRIISEGSGEHFIENVKQCITSGSLTNINVWQQVSGFDNRLFIDLVDFDFCKRLRLSGFKILEINTYTLQHTIGNSMEHKIFLFKIISMNHSAFRKYFMTRNQFYMLKKYPNYISRERLLLRIIKLLFSTVLFENHKVEKTQFIFKGIKDGFKIHLDPWMKESKK